MDAPTPKSAVHDLRSHHVRVGELEWKPTRFAGCEVKTLLFDRDTGLVTALMRFAPGAVLPDHEHVKIEQTLVLEGKLVDREGPDTGLEVPHGRFRVAPGRQPAFRLVPGGRADARDVPGAQQVLRARWSRHRHHRRGVGQALGSRRSVNSLSPSP